MSRPESPGTWAAGRARRGISIVGTEDRLVRLSMKRATLASMLLHAVGPFALTALVLLVLLIASWLLNFNLWDWFKPKEKPVDIEFSLVTDTNAKRPDNPVMRGNFNQEAGGKRDPHQPLKPVSDPEQAPPARAVNPVPPQPQNAPQPVQRSAPPEPPKPQVKPSEAAKAPPKPSFNATVPIPVPQSNETAVVSGPVARTAPGGSADAAPGPIASTGGLMAGPGASAGSLSNAQGGAGANPGVDVAMDVDFGPFMADIERRIKRNWKPPRGSESRRVKLLFYLARDGRVVKIETRKSSGDEDADKAAIAAVEASAPFMPFPPQVREEILPVEFTFDYNVLNPKNAKQALKW